MKARALALATAMLTLPVVGSAQLAERVSETEDGVVRFHFETRADVEVCDQGVRIGESHHRWNWRRGDELRGCRIGVAEIDLRMRDGSVRSVTLTDSEARRRADVLDLGLVSASEASGWLLGLAYTDADPDAAEDALMPAMLADVPDSWRGVLRLARDTRLDDGIRKDALFWLGQAASSTVTDELAEVANDNDEEQDIRDAAVFALSQRPDEESIPILMELAETAEHGETRKKAMFWLAQSDDPRVVDFFADILLRGDR